MTFQLDLFKEVSELLKCFLQVIYRMEMSNLVSTAPSVPLAEYQLASYYQLSEAAKW